VRTVLKRLSTKRFESDASGVPEILHAFTAQPDEDALKGRLERLNSFPEALLILNHPLWDEKKIGLAQHEQTLKSLLAFSRNRLHALEVNGLRSFAENRRVMDLGDMVGWPVVSGGNRHGCEPNAILNLTEASTFDEFAQQVRSGRSHVVFMPQYREPLTWRTMRTVVDNVVMRGVLLGEELATAYADYGSVCLPFPHGHLRQRCPGGLELRSSCSG
jgi:hypothetical protein